MRRVIWSSLLCLSLFAVGSSQQSDAPLTNAGVVQLVKAGFKEKTVIRIINNRPSNFQLDIEELIKLKRNNVSENIILAMMSAQDAGDWESDPFFTDRKKPNAGGDSQSQSTNIFGSGGNSQSSSKREIGQDDNQNEGNVAGGASVRIIKPPAQGAPPKLEKTPTLSNEGVIRLVEAGFSEGTIIKTIQESPVDFDFSPGKLDELYKKRVTDAIIAAMRAAMGDN